MRRQTKDGTWHHFNFNAEMLRSELLANGAPESEVNDYVACDIQREADIECGRQYYDYDRQEWRNV